MKKDTLLEVKDLHTYFYTEEGVVKALSGIDFSIERGKTIGLVGESGCGKTVTALSILRLIPSPIGRIVRGEIRLDNQNLLALTESEMRKIRGNNISMIFQEPMTSLNPVYTVGNQIAEAIWLHQNISKREAFHRAVEMLEKVRIPDPKNRIHEYPYEMSGGMRQRVMIAIALACRPNLIIGDEPTTALDVTIQAQILYLINDLKDEIGASVLLISHDFAVIAEMAETVCVMYAGKIVEHARVANIFENPKHPYTIGLLDSIPKVEDPVPAGKKLNTIPGFVPDLLNLPKGCHFQSRCQKVFEPCREKTPRLVEVEPGHLVRCWQYV